MTLFVQGTYTGGEKDIRDNQDPNFRAILTAEQWDEAGWSRAKVEAFRAQNLAADPDFEKKIDAQAFDESRQAQDAATTSGGDGSNDHNPD